MARTAGHVKPTGGSWMDPPSSICILVVQRSCGDPFHKKPIQGKEIFVKNILSVTSVCWERMPESCRHSWGFGSKDATEGPGIAKTELQGTCPQPRKLYSPPKKCENWISGG